MKVLDSFSLEGKVALLTGGAGKYGRQIAYALAEAGAETYMASRNVEKLEILASELREQGYKAKALYYDQGKEETILALRDEILKQSGRIDILVNNAVARTTNDWDDPAENFTKSMIINGTGIFLMCRTFGDVMAAQGGGSIINIASMMGMVGPDKNNYEGLNMGKSAGDYYFHKAGMINFTKFVASKYGARNVRCNAVSPGGLFANQPELFVERYNKRTLLGRMANDTDLKGVIVFLASDASLYITGANIPVDGGYTAI
ncbi:MAG TPA: SDR family oxidoreductase [Clostridiaceae bacterium]|nr:SDR family oxidoreductase [Clostridiaceae bacterium]